MLSPVSTRHKAIGALWLPRFHDFEPFLRLSSSGESALWVKPAPVGTSLLACGLSNVGYAIAVHVWVLPDCWRWQDYFKSKKRLAMSS